MRLFIAINLPTAIEEELKTIQLKIPTEHASFTATKDFHLTLKFLGDVDKKDIPKIVEKLKEIKFQEFPIRLRHIGYFPDEKFISVVWIGIDENKQLVELQEKIEDSLLMFKFKKDFEFHPHLTLARVKHIKDRNEFLQTMNDIRVPKLEFTASDFRLIESTLTSEGPKYEDVEIFK